MKQGSPIVLYSTEEGNIVVPVRFENEDFWLAQRAIAELFDTTAANVNIHIKNILAEKELDEDLTIKESLIVQLEGNRQVSRRVQLYSLDIIIAIGYRVNSRKATRFRQWATKTLHEYIHKGFVLNDDMLKNSKPFGWDYFDELLERVREIRASERRAYRKIADVFEQCSYDYDKNSELTRDFYAFVQNKLHYAVTGQTAAELIAQRANLEHPSMGLTPERWTEGKDFKSDVVIAKSTFSRHQL